MSVNISNSNSQQVAVALNQAMSSELDKLTQDKKETDKAVDKSTIEKMLSSKKEQDGASRELITNLATKLIGSGINLAESVSGKINNNAKDEYDLMFKSEGEKNEDVSTLTRQQTAVGKASNKKGDQEGKDGQQNQQQAGSENKGETIKEYRNLYSQFLLSGGNELKKRIEKMEIKLQQEGLSGKDLLSLQNSISKSIRSEVASQMKELWLKRALSDEKSLDFKANTRAINDLFGEAFKNEKLGGWDFGGYLDNLQNVMNEKAREASQDIREFVKNEMEQKLTQSTLFKDVPDKEIANLLEIGQKVGFNPMNFLGQWQVQANDIGLIPVPQQANVQSGMSADAGSNHEKKQNTGYEFSQDDEKDLMINQLRALCMKRAVRGDIRTLVETSFKIRKLKNGLIKMGINFGDIDQIEKEGLAIGRIKLIEMLKEAFYERSTLYDLSGPAFELIERKIKTVLKNLEKIGVSVSKRDLDSLRDEANKNMFDVVRSELEHDEALFGSNQNPRLEKKIKLMIKLLKRIKEESNIGADIKDVEDISFIKSSA